MGTSYTEFFEEFIAKVTPKLLTQQRFILGALVDRFCQNPEVYLTLDELLEAVKEGLKRRDLVKGLGIPREQDLDRRTGNLMDNMEKLRQKVKRWGEETGSRALIEAHPAKGWRLVVPHPPAEAVPCPEGVAEVAGLPAYPPSEPETREGVSPQEPGLRHPGAGRRMGLPRVLVALGAVALLIVVVVVSARFFTGGPPADRSIAHVTVNEQAISFVDFSGRVVRKVPSLPILQKVLKEQGISLTEAEEAEFRQGLNWGSGRSYHARGAEGVFDLDGDGQKEALISVRLPGLIQPNGLLIALDVNGRVRWVVKAMRGQIRTASQEFPNTWFLALGLVDDLDGDGKPDLVVSRYHRDEWPTALLLMDPATGKVRSEYWNSGFIHPYLTIDLNGDGVKEVIAGGVNNEGVIDDFGEAFYAVVDLVNTPVGASPQKAGVRYHLQGLPPEGKGALLYARITPVATTRFLRMYETTIWMERLRKGYEFFVGYPRSGSRAGWALCAPGMNKTELELCAQSYEFTTDENLRIGGFRPRDDYLTFHSRLLKEGKVSISVDEMMNKWRKQVLYWDGAQWVPRYTLVK